MVCTQSWSLPWEFHLMTAHTQVHSMSSCGSSHFTCLFISPSLASWCKIHSCDDVLVMLNVFYLCVLFVFVMKKVVALTHGVTFTVEQPSSQSANEQSQVSHLSPTPLVSHVVHMCLDVLICLVFKSCKCVLKYHIYIFYSFTHLVIFLKFWRLDSPLTTETSPHHRLDLLSPRTT